MINRWTCRMRYAVLLLVVLLAIALFSGCSYLLEREYRFSNAHVSTDNETGDMSMMIEVGDYDELKEQIMSYVRLHESELTVRLRDESDDVEQSLKVMLNQLQNDPLYAYAVSTVAYHSYKILTYYEISFDITYSRSSLQIDGMLYADNMIGFEQQLGQRLLEYPEQVVFRVSNYSDNFNIEALYRELCLSHPEVDTGILSISAQTYPDSGTERVVEIVVSYPEMAAILKRKSIKAEDQARQAVEQMPENLSTAEQYLWLHDYLCETAEYVRESEDPRYRRDHYLEYSAYGALLEKTAVSEGYAKAYRLLCHLAGLRCELISGLNGGVSHMWNLILVDDQWYHVDCADDDMKNGIGYRFFGISDESIGAFHIWDTAAYPTCESSDLHSEMLMHFGLNAWKSGYDGEEVRIPQIDPDTAPDTPSDVEPDAEPDAEPETKT